MNLGNLFVKGSRDTLTSFRLIYDYYKHITTLSLGVVLFISAFLNVGKSDELSKFFILVSILSFLLSIVFSLKIMKYIANAMTSISSAQGFGQLADATAILDPQKQLEELKKIGVQLNAFMDPAAAEISKLQKWINPTWASFLCGVTFAVLYIISPIVTRLWVSIIALLASA